MKSYFGIFKMTFKGELQYRAKAISGMCTQFFWGIMYIFLYTAFLGGKIIDGFSVSQMASYIWLGQAFFVLRYITLPVGSANAIVNGNVCYKFVRPVNIYNQWYAEHFGQKLSATILRFLPICLIAFLLPNNIGLSLPASPIAFLLFVVSLCIGGLLVSALSMFAINLTFLTHSPKGTTTTLQTISGLLGGMFIPIPLMPQPVQKILNFLPFRYITDLPFRLYIGNVSIQNGLTQIGIGLIWLIIIILLGKFMLKLSLKKTTIQGG